MTGLPLKEQHLQRFAGYGLSDPPNPICQYAVFSPGELLAREGEPTSHLYIGISGRAKVCCHCKNTYWEETE